MELYSQGEKNHLLSSIVVFWCEIIMLIALFLAGVLLKSDIMFVAFWLAIIAIIIFNHYVPMNFSDRMIVYGKKPLLGSFNGIGFVFFHPYRIFGDYEIRYAFFSIFYIPIFPIGCYAATLEDREFSFIFPRSEYSVNGAVSFNAIEALNIFLRFPAIIAVLVLFYKLVSLY